MQDTISGYRIAVNVLVVPQDNKQATAGVILKSEYKFIYPLSFEDKAE